MLIKEDYFKDLELSTDDIDDNETFDSYNISDCCDLTKLNDYFTSKYKQSLSIKIAMKDNKNIYTISDIWETIIPNMIKKLQYIMNAYNVEYEYIVIDNTSLDAEMTYKQFGNVNVLYPYSYIKEPGDSLYYDRLRNTYLIIYANFPDFTYKESYNFIDRIQNVIWKDKFLRYELVITQKPISLTYDRLLMFNVMNATKLLSLRDDKFRNQYVSNGLPYKRFFCIALQTFNNTPYDIQNIQVMLKKLLSHKDPFVKQN